MTPDILESVNIPYRRAIISCGLLSVLGLLLFIVGVVANGRLTHGYLFWNLILAWIPLVVAVLIDRHTKNAWTPQNIALGIVWLLFLPNTFYMLTDYVHVTEVARADPVFDSVMFSVVISVGFALGIMSLLIVHKTLLRIVNDTRAKLIIGAVITASSFAIYLGRELRFNSWDVITNPFGLIVDMCQIFIQPHQNLDAYITTLTFFIVTAAAYAVSWYVIEEPRKRKT